MLILVVPVNKGISVSSNARVTCSLCFTPRCKKATFPCWHVVLNSYMIASGSLQRSNIFKADFFPCAEFNFEKDMTLTSGCKCVLQLDSQKQLACVPCRIIISKSRLGNDRDCTLNSDSVLTNPCLYTLKSAAEKCAQPPGLSPLTPVRSSSSPKPLPAASLDLILSF